MWFGLGYLINFCILKSYTFKNIKINLHYVYVFSSLCLITFLILITNTFNKHHAPFVTSNTTKGLIKLNDLAIDKDNAVIAAPWSYGYQSVFYNDIPVLIHNGMPTSPRHYFMSRAFSASDLEETKKILNYIASGNVEKINDKNIDSFQSLAKDIYKASLVDKDIYLFLTEQQRVWIKSTGATAFWDIENNKPYTFNGVTAFDIFNINEIDCEDLDPKTLTTKCARLKGSLDKDLLVNLALGIWDGKPIIKRVVQISDGKIEINEEYDNPEANYVFQIIKNTDEDTVNIYFMHEVVFRSSYNKLFHLNEIEDYELVYDDYPNVKIYKIN
jgi:hypothetical protein